MCILLLGLVQITLQEMQHSCPLLTSRIVREGGREVFRPMEVPTLPIDRDIQCQDMLHTRLSMPRNDNDDSMLKIYFLLDLTQKMVPSGEFKSSPNPLSKRPAMVLHSVLRWKPSLRMTQTWRPGGVTT